MPQIKFWVNGIATTASSEALLTDAGRAEVERKEALTKWSKLVERAALAAAVLSAFGGIFADKPLRHRFDFIAIALGALAMALKFVNSHR
jgi:hypothetical protein